MLYVTCAILASVLSNLGLALQSHDARRLPRRGALSLALIRELARHPLWVAGTVASLAASALQIVALSRLPIAFVQPTMAAGIVLVPLAAWRISAEAFQRRVLLALALLIGGVTCLGLTLPADRSVFEGSVLALLAPPAVVIAIFAALETLRECSGRSLAVLSGTCFATTGVLAKLVATSTFAGGEFWLFVAALVAFAAVGFLAEMSALQRSPATVVAPIVLVTATLLPVLVARLFLGEDWPHGELTAAALALVVATAGWMSRLAGADIPEGRKS